MCENISLLILLSEGDMSISWMYERLNSTYVYRTPKGFVSQITCVGYLNGKKICITTCGDSYRYDIATAIEKGEQILGDIDLFVCASHGAGTDSLKLKFIKKERFDENEREERDKLFSNEVVETILDY